MPEASWDGIPQSEKYEYFVIDMGLTKFTTRLTGTGTISQEAQEINLGTGTTLGSWAEATLGPAVHFSREIRTNILVSGIIGVGTSVDYTNYQVYFGIAQPWLSTPNKPRVCFDILSGVVRASCADGVATTTLGLGVTLPDDTFSRICTEIIFYPNAKAEFYIDGILKGIITNNLPNATQWGDPAQMSITNLAAENKHFLFGGCLITRIKKAVG